MYYFYVTLTTFCPFTLCNYFYIFFVKKTLTSKRMFTNSLSLVSPLITVLINKTRFSVAKKYYVANNNFSLVVDRLIPIFDKLRVE